MVKPIPKWFYKVGLRSKRKIGGKTYHPYRFQYRKKSNAKKKAKSFRRRFGVNARVVKGRWQKRNVWRIYISKKGRKRQGR